MKTKLVWFWKGFLLSVIAALAFTVTNCDNGGSLVKDNGGHSGEPDTPQESYSLVGKWYEVGSTDAEGRIVVFTDTTVTAWRYLNNYVDEAGIVRDWEIKWLDEVAYSLSNDTLVLLNHNLDGLDPSYPFKTPIEFHSNDTLVIQHFLLITAAIPFPFVPIKLCRRSSHEN